jgi:hypothetical protein
MSEQLMKDDEMDHVLNHHLKLKLMHFDDLAGAPSQIVSQLMLHAFGEGFDYFFQVNDDTFIKTGNWAKAYIDALVSNPVASNLGVTGPTDSNNEKIFTHSFVHRTHIEVCTFNTKDIYLRYMYSPWVCRYSGTTSLLCLRTGGVTTGSRQCMESTLSGLSTIKTFTHLQYNYNKIGFRPI